MAKTFYEITRISWGDDSPKTGWYLQRVIVSFKQNGEPCSVIDKKPLAKFVDGETSTDATSLALAIFDEVKDGTFHMLPQDWKFDDLPKDRG